MQYEVGIGQPPRQLLPLGSLRLLRRDKCFDMTKCMGLVAAMCVKYCVGWEVLRWRASRSGSRRALYDVMQRVLLIAGRVRVDMHVALRERSSRQLLRPCGRHVRAGCDMLS
jgi:hypothetical protein